MGFDEALRTHDPDFVLSCWMPMGHDWTAAFRAKASVREYILIGESDYGICGHPWRTWGFRGGGYGGGSSSDSESESGSSSSGGGGDDARGHRAAAGRDGGTGGGPAASKRCVGLLRC